MDALYVRSHTLLCQALFKSESQGATQNGWNTDKKKEKEQEQKQEGIVEGIIESAQKPCLPQAAWVRM